MACPPSTSPPLVGGESNSTRPKPSPPVTVGSSRIICGYLIPPNSMNTPSSQASETVPAVVTSDWLGSLWRPIETAPKDSTPVDLWVPDRKERLANYVRMERSPTNVFYVPVYAGTCFVRNASHWMPIPSAPNDKAHLRQPDHGSRKETK